MPIRYDTIHLFKREAVKNFSLSMKYLFSIFVIGFSLFSMFFGGGNLVFPLWVGMESTSPIYSILGFLVSGVLLPFYGITIGIYFKGNFHRYLSVWGKQIAQPLIFLLLLFWIPLGSGPRCNLLAYGAFCEVGGSFVPLWVFSLVYTGVVFLLTFRRGNFLEILGKIVTPLLVFFLFLLIISVFGHLDKLSLLGDMNPSSFTSSLVQGYNTMDFIAAMFFSSAIISLLMEKQKEKFSFRFVRSACLIAMSLLSIVYIGMFFIGYVQADALHNISGAHLIMTVGNLMLGEKFKFIIFMIVTLSVLSTSMALSFVVAEYIQKTIFKNRLPYPFCLGISLVVSFVMSMLGFENLAVFISYIMRGIYPVLLITTTVAFCKQLLLKPSLDDVANQVSLNKSSLKESTD